MQIKRKSAQSDDDKLLSKSKSKFGILDRIEKVENEKKTDWQKHAMFASLFLSASALGLVAYNVIQMDKMADKMGIVSGVNQVAPPPTNYKQPAEFLENMDPATSYLGSTDAQITIVEFGDYQCPFCGRFFDEVYPDLKQQYIDTGKVKFTYVDYPFLGLESTRAAEAAACAKDQDKFWEMHDELFENQGGENVGVFDDENLYEFAANIGLNAVQFDECMTNSPHADQIADGFKMAHEQYGVTSTPTFFINGVLVRGAQAYTVFQQTIDQQLAQ